MSNYALLVAPFAGWIIAQFIKFCLTLRKDGVQWSDALQSGGMPSAHSAFMLSLTTAIGLKEGVSSAAFAIALSVAAIVIYDATGVRRTTGEQSRAIAQIVQKSKVQIPLIHDARGHTPLEVIAGMAVGIATGITTVVVL